MTTVFPFDEDVKVNQGYRYTTNAPLSSQLSNSRISQEIISNIPGKAKTLLDIGCGDGVYTQEIKDNFPSMKVSGFDPAPSAIAYAKEKYKHIKFYIDDIERIKFFPKKKYDVAVVRGVLHHLSHPKIAINAIPKFADYVIVVEPNGRNPIVKFIEKVSPYHRLHEEKSYPPDMIKKWFKQSHMELISEAYIGYVPFFFPQTLSKILYFLQPYLEKSIVFSKFFSGQVVMVFHNLK